MKSRMIICILMSIALLNTASAAGDGGVNIEPVVEDTIFSEITHTETTTDLEDWEITMTLNSDAASNTQPDGEDEVKAFALDDDYDYEQTTGRTRFPMGPYDM